MEERRRLDLSSLPGTVTECEQTADGLADKASVRALIMAVRKTERGHELENSHRHCSVLWGKLQMYLALNEEEDADKRYAVMALGISQLILGSVFVAVDSVGVRCTWMISLGAMLWVLGLCILTTMDTCLNCIFAQRRGLFYLLNAAMIAMTTLQAFGPCTFPGLGSPAFLIPSAFSLLYVLIFQWCILPTTFFACYFALYSSFGIGASRFLYLLSGNLQINTDAATGLFAAAGVISFLGGLCTVSVYVLAQRWWAYDPTQACYLSFHTSSFCSTGLSFVPWSLAARDIEECTNFWTGQRYSTCSPTTAMRLLWAPLVIIPLLFAKYRTTCYGLVSRMLQKRQRVADGAFMASIITPVNVRELEEKGCRKLRCVPISCITLQVLKKQPLGEPVDTTAKYTLSTPCEPGDIDFFITHSWSDDPVQKYAALQQLSERFQAEYGREPQVWIDACCINQSQIGDDLQCLPVYLLASQRLLVLCGATFASRLWCIWEIYVFFTMVKDAAARTVFWPVSRAARFRASCGSRWQKHNAIALMTARSSWQRS